MNIAIISHSYHENRLHFDYIQKGEPVNAYFNACLAFLSLQWNGKVRICTVPRLVP